MNQKQAFKQLYAYCELRGLESGYIKQFILPPYWTQEYEDNNPNAIHLFCLMIPYYSTITIRDLIEARKPCPWRFS